MTWDELDWTALDRLRDGFLSGRAAEGPYWKSRSDLASYDFTYAERIGWKWDAVIRELRLRDWVPPVGLLVDWGCGSGVAGRRVLAAWGADRFAGLRVWDHSPLARDFAADVARQQHPGLEVRAWSSDEPIGLLVLSHVLNELSPEAQAELQGLVARAAAVIWVEPGTSLVSRALGTWRERVRATHRIVAPCTHQAACGVLVAGRERDWCHHFARPPGGIFADSRWVRFGQRAGIDLRSLPYSHLVLERNDVPSGTKAWPDQAERLLGRPEHFKPYARFLSCGPQGVEELTLPKRTCAALYKELERTTGPLVYRWRKAEGQILEGHAVLGTTTERPE